MLMVNMDTVGTDAAALPEWDVQLHGPAPLQRERPARVDVLPERGQHGRVLRELAHRRASLSLCLFVNKCG